MRNAMLCSEPRIDGRAVDAEVWYPAVISDFVLDTLLSGVAERDNGFRRRVDFAPSQGCFANVLTRYLSSRHTN